MNTETIAAIATSVSNSGISIIRVSGDDALTIGNKIFKSIKSDFRLIESKSHTVHYGYIMDNERIVDEVLITVMKAPNTYTKEDTIEINCHGGVLVTKNVLETVVKNGARIAEPGEFTKRAFLNGRIDLSQAEAVIDVINAQNDYALTSSVNQLKGSVSSKIRELREMILDNIAFIEAALDDPEHISMDNYDEELAQTVDIIKKELKKLIDSADNGRIITEGIKTVILGKPNAGKSSLLNILVGEERAIVTDVAGTTRDTLEENINLNGISLNVIDTAGIRDSQDIVEKIGIEKAKNLANNADLIIYVVDSSVELDDNDKNIINIIKDKKSIILLNKIDLNQVVEKSTLEKLTDKPILSISAKEEKGIEEFSELINSLFIKGEISMNNEVYITNARQKSMILAAYESICQVENSIKKEMSEDFYSIDLMSAYESLGLVVGESVEDDLVNQIFSKFCMGK